MKKLILTTAAVLVLLTSVSAQNRLFVSLGASVIRPADEAYRSLYGNQALYPEVTFAVRLVKGLVVSSSFGQFTKKGTTPDLELETKSKQGYFSIGLGYLQRISGYFCVEGVAGAAALSFREDALDTQIKGQQWGPLAEAGIFYMPEEGGGLFLGLKFGYVGATVKDIASDIAGTQPVKLGGMKLALCVGIQVFGGD